jgi:anaerobic magnesium-protoporphyrin IX monomethyl ester cyclase
LHYPWIRDKFKRRYMLGCLKAFAKTTLSKKFYDLERLKYKGLSTEVDLGFDESKILSREEIAKLKEKRPDLSADIDFTGVKGRGPAAVSACGAPNDLRPDLSTDLHPDLHQKEQKAVAAETN